jgi:hypothetical protein
MRWEDSIRLNKREIGYKDGRWMDRYGSDSIFWFFSEIKQVIRRHFFILLYRELLNENITKEQGGVTHVWIRNRYLGK